MSVTPANPGVHIEEFTGGGVVSEPAWNLAGGTWTADMVPRVLSQGVVVRAERGAEAR